MARKAPAKRPVAKKASARSAAASKAGTAVRKAPAKRPVAKKAPVGSAAASKAGTAKRAPAKKPPVKKPVAKKPTAKRAPVKKAVAKKPAARKAPAKKAVAKKAPAKKSRAKGAATAKVVRKKSRFSVGDKVAHPQHGAATITGTAKIPFDGEERDYFILQISTENLKVSIPTDIIDESIRPVISKTAVTKVLRVFKVEPQDAGSNWSRWYKILTEKVHSGDIFQVAEVVRDLTHAQNQKGISPALKRMLSKARQTLTSEIAFALGADQEEATRRVDKALPQQASAS